MNNCTNQSYDNRETCGELIPSSCVANTGYVSPTLFPDGLCRPNINDILKKLQETVDAIKVSLGDNTELDELCFSIDPATATQEEINQEIFTKVCALQTAVTALQAAEIDPDDIMLSVDLLCLLDPTCDPQSEYSLTDIVNKLLAAWCNFVTTGTFTVPPPSTNYSTTAQALTAATRTYIVGSKIIVPSTKLKVGTIFKWKLNVTKTAAGSASSTFDIAVGTTASVADTARVSFTKPAGTAAADEGLIEITAVVRSIGVAGVLVGEFTLIHNLASTGHATIPCICVNTISAGFDTTVPNLFLGICSTTGSADAITVQLVTAEAVNL